MVGYTYRAAFGPLHRTEPNEDGSCPRRVSQDISLRPLLCAVVKHTEVAMGACAACMYHTLRNTLVVEAGDLLPCDLILE